MKAKFHNMLKDVTKGQLIFWWVLRGLLIFALFYTIIVGHGPLGEYEGSNPWQQVVANLVGMFAYEIIQLFFPKNSFFRNLSPGFQCFTALGFFLGSFGGAFLNFYYIVPMYDKILHATGTAEAVYVGYELISALQMKIKKPCPPRIIVFAALGIGLALACGWEIFEFTYDQFFSGDAQHWNVMNAIAEAGGNWEDVFLMFPLKSWGEEAFMSRFALMDTMSDTIMNFIGAFIMVVVLRKYPYRHRGEKDLNRMFAENTAD